jgi:hypothetical protein
MAMPATATPDLASHLETLCAIFDAEAERQEILLDATRAQVAAAHARDIELLVARTRAMTLLVEETAAAEANRMDAVRAAVALLGLPSEDVTLSVLIGVVPEPWKSRLAEFQQRIRATMMATRQVVQENQAFLRRTARAATKALESATAAVSARGGAYNHQGSDGPRESGPSLLDRQG